jgi:hypothetical protein
MNAPRPENNRAAAAAGPLHDYLTGSGRDARGRSVHEVLGYSDDQLEEIHDYIQWLFPLPTRSSAQPSAPVLTGQEIEAIQSDPRAVATLQQATRRMLEFYRNTDGWLTGFDHNHLRVTRIIQSLRLLVSLQAACDFYKTILHLQSAAGAPVNSRSLDYWRQATEE